MCIDLEIQRNVEREAAGMAMATLSGPIPGTLKLMRWTVDRIEYPNEENLDGN